MRERGRKEVKKGKSCKIFAINLLHLIALLQLGESIYCERVAKDHLHLLDSDNFVSWCFDNPSAVHVRSRSVGMSWGGDPCWCRY